MAGIVDDDLAALDFDLACAYRYELYDIERDKTRAKLIAYEVSKMFGDGSESGGDDVDISGVEVW